MKKKIECLTLLSAVLLIGVCPAGAYPYIPSPQHREYHEMLGRMVESEYQTERDIPSDAFYWNGHYYYIFENCDTWEEAEQFCESLGGHLATISSKRENDVLYRYVKECGYRSAYFGYTDNVREGSWYWVNGERPYYENWHRPTEPNAENPREDYAMFYFKFKDGTWNDGDFGGSTVNGGRVFICEWD